MRFLLHISIAAALFYLGFYTGNIHLTENQKQNTQVDFPDPEEQQVVENDINNFIKRPGLSDRSGLSAAFPPRTPEEIKYELTENFTEAGVPQKDLEDMIQDLLMIHENAQPRMEQGDS